MDLQVLNYHDKILVNEEIVYPKEYYANTEIVELNNCLVNGSITNRDDLNYLVQLDVTGTMILHDSITYDLVPYNFQIEIEETLEKSTKTLDLIEFLWHYIVLEVPLRFTNSEITSQEMDGYRIISEEEYNKRKNPFSDFFIE